MKLNVGISNNSQPKRLMPSDGADFWKHRKCYGRVFSLVKGGAEGATICPIIVDGMAIEIRRYARQAALKVGIESVTNVLKLALKGAGGLFNETPASRAMLKTEIDRIRREYAEHESTRLICDGLLTAGHSFINQLQSDPQQPLSSFEEVALKAVFRLQAAHNIIDPLRDYHLRFQGLEPEQYDARQTELLDRTEAEGLLLLKSCLKSKSGAPSKNWRSGGKPSFKNDLDSLNTGIGISL
jgi:hypothetical protein